jgi:dihydroorotase
MNLEILNGRVINPANNLDTQQNIFIHDDTIIAIGEKPASFIADDTIDAQGLIVCPGLIDISARLKEPGQPEASIDSETRAASAGGITSLCVPPDISPLIDSPATVELIEERAKKAGRAMVYPMGSLTQKLEGELLTEMAALSAAGCIGFSNGRQAIQNSLVLRRAMEYAASLDLKIYIHAADPWLKEGCVHEGATSTRLGLTGIPETAETIALTRDLLLIEQTGVSAHFHSISCGKSIELIKEPQRKGLSVTADVTAHHLHLSEHDIGNYDSFSHVMPPLRSTRDREQLQQGLRDGVISAICSSHKPLSNDAKLGPFAETTPGISGLETLLPLTLKLVEDEEITLQQAIASLTCQPATILGIEAGQLKVGAQADICIFDPNSQYQCEPKNFISTGKNSPFAGWQFKNKVKYTLYKGKRVFVNE